MTFSQEIIEDLKSHYNAPGRFYHTWSHIEALLTLFESIRSNLVSPKTVELAIYYHDVVYDPRSASNETESAAKLDKDLASSCGAENIAHCRKLIEATIKHEIPPDMDQSLRNDCSYFLDLDLAILGEDADTYDAYAEAIRREYEFVPSPLYEQERTKVLNRFLARDRLYFTNEFYNSREASARQNIKRELHHLDSEIISHG